MSEWVNEVGGQSIDQSISITVFAFELELNPKK